VASDRKARGIRFDPDVDDRLEREAEERMVSVNWIVNRLVREGLDRIVPLDEFKLTRDA
jgi:hypothetical protein